MPARFASACLIAAIALLCALYPAAIAQEGDGPDLTIPEGGFRTEADDLAELEELGQAEAFSGTQLGRLGAVTLPVSMPYDGQATLALYTPAGQLVRILGQVLDLSAGEYEVRWDGMDLFGNLVPAGTDLQLKVITTPGLKATYQFTVGHGNPDQPWGGSYTNEQGERRHGGWLGDHSTPNAAVAVGDHVALGSFLAEDGDNLILVNQDFEKIWGMKLAGWTGPDTLRSDGKALYALQRRGSAVHRIDPFTFDDRGRVARRKLIDPGKDRILAFAARGDELLLVQRNHEIDTNHFRAPFGGGDIDHAASVPQVLGTSAPTEFHTSPQGGFNRTFSGGGHPQAGATMTRRGGVGYVVLGFKRPATFGSVLLARTPGLERVELHALADDLVYDALQHSPLREGGDSAKELAGLGLDLEEFDENWVKVAQTNLEQELSLLTPEKRVTTRAVYFKAKLDEKDAAGKPRLKLAQFLAEPTAFLETSAKLTTAADTADQLTPVGSDTRPGLHARTAARLSDDSPLTFVIDYASPQTFDGILLYNPINPRIRIDAFLGEGDPDAALREDAAWQPLAEFHGGSQKKIGSYTATKDHNARIVRLESPATTRALRFRVTEGYRTGKYATLMGGPGGAKDDDPMWAQVDQIALLRLTDPPPTPPSRILAIHDANTGEKKRELRGHDELDLQTLAAAEDGTLYSVIDDRLHRTTITQDGVSHEPLHDHVFSNASDLTVSAERIAVTDSGAHLAYVFDRAGKLRMTIGTPGETRDRGPWIANRLGKPNGVALDAQGRVWLAESSFAPKRVSVWSADGQHEKDLLGPPMYGGGGSLDPNLRSFYYRGIEYDLDFAQGTSRLKASNDRAYQEATLGLEASTFAFTGLGQPYRHDGRRYIIGGSSGGYVIALHPENKQGRAWTPAVVMGPAEDSVFLLRKKAWRDHFGAMDLRDRYFIWCDANDNQQFEIDEVELMHADDWPHGQRPPTGGTMGPEMTLYGTYKWSPHRFTSGGVPVFRFADAKPFYDRESVPHYRRNYTLGGPTSAKPGPGDFKLVTDAGRMIREGQPFIIEPDGSILGGPPPQPSDFSPEIDGNVLNQPWKFTGGGMTDSDVGYVAAVNSNNGYWYAWAADLGVIVGTFFDGKEGGWDTSLRATRGTDVTHRKHGWEGWGGDFVKADDGHFYAVAGKGFHGISRIDGLNDIAVQTTPVRIEATHVAVNTTLRPVIAARQQARALANGKSSRKSLAVPELSKRARDVKIDGQIEEWGSPARMPAIGAENSGLRFDLARDERGLYVVLRGKSKMGNTAKSPAEVLSQGFAFELMVRPQAGNRSRDVVAGDRRVVFGQVEGRWTAVLFDYEPTDNADTQEAVSLATAGARARIGRVGVLDEHQCRFVMSDTALGVSLDTLDDLEGLGEAPTLLGDERPAPAAKRAVDASRTDWTAEVFLPWQTLGLEAAPGRLRLDVAVNEANAAGDGVAERTAWSDASAGLGVADRGVLATINPAAWGHLELGR